MPHWIPVGTTAPPSVMTPPLPAPLDPLPAPELDPPPSPLLVLWVLEPPHATASATPKDVTKKMRDHFMKATSR
jgi:hypothetical protein